MKQPIEGDYGPAFWLYTFEKNGKVYDVYGDRMTIYKIERILSLTPTKTKQDGCEKI